MEFASSARSSVGIEWELALVDPGTGDLVPEAANLVASIGDARFDEEFLTCMIELISGVHSTTDAALDEMRSMRDLAATAAERAGLALIGSGTHPSARWRDTQVPDEAVYRRMVEASLDWGRQQVIFGVHTHVGTESTAKIARIMRVVTGQLPLILALSASSPFWAGSDTGYASHRTMLFQQLPTGGLPPALDDWNAYRGAANDLLAAGAIEQVREIRWDVRPSPALGTVEVRIADGATSLDELAAVTALTHCLIEEASRAIDHGRTTEPLPSWLLRENKWRAARYGLDAVIVIDRSCEQHPVREALLAAVERLAPIASDLGAPRSLAAARRVVEGGGSAAAQRRNFRHGGMPEVLRGLRDRFIS